MPEPPSTSGMTLVEVLVALAVFGLLLAALTAMMHFTYNYSAMRIRTSEARAESAPVLDFIEALIGDSRPVATVAGNLILFEGETDRLTIVAPLGEGFAKAGGLQVIRLGMVAGELRIAWAPFGERALPVPETAGTTALLAGLSNIRFRYFGRSSAATGTIWHDTWKGMTSLPTSIDITLKRENDNTQSELIVALRVTGTASSNQR